MVAVRSVFAMVRLVASFALLVPAFVAGLDNGLGLTPALGFNTWNAFGTQSKVLRSYLLSDGVWRVACMFVACIRTCVSHAYVPVCIRMYLSHMACAYAREYYMHGNHEIYI